MGDVEAWEKYKEFSGELREKLDVPLTKRGHKNEDLHLQGESIFGEDLLIKTIVNPGSNLDLRTSAFKIFDITLDQNLTFTFSEPFSTGILTEFQLLLRASVSRTLTWPGSVIWNGGTAQTTVSNTLILNFLTVDAGTNWFSNFIGSNYS